MLAHHNKELTNEFILRAMRGLCPPSWTESQIQAQFETVKKYDYRTPLGFPWPHPFRPSSLLLQLSYIVRPSTKWGVSSGRNYEWRIFETQDKEWLAVTGPTKMVDWSQVADATWFLDRARAALPFFEPDYAAAHIDTKMAGAIDKGLDNFVWPVMLYGPPRVAKMGEKLLLDAPAWKVERLSYGGIWIQSDENPFAPDEHKLKTLAKHLGLKMPRNHPSGRDST